MVTCPHCDAPLVSLSSQNVRLCSACKREYPWHLKPGQKPIVSNNREGRKR